MTAPNIPTAEFVGIAQRSLDATSTAVQTWTETLENYASSVSTEHPLPRTTEVRTALKAWYDLSIALLTEQRALTVTMIDAGSEAADAWGEQVRTATAAVPFRASDVMRPFAAAAA